MDKLHLLTGIGTGLTKRPYKNMIGALDALVSHAVADPTAENQLHALEFIGDAADQNPHLVVHYVDFIESCRKVRSYFVREAANQIFAHFIEQAKAPKSKKRYGLACRAAPSVI
jgi:hypothetical protein